MTAGKISCRELNAWEQVQSDDALTLTFSLHAAHPDARHGGLADWTTTATRCTPTLFDQMHTEIHKNVTSKS
jgi:hypothetical protein